MITQEVFLVVGVFVLFILGSNCFRHLILLIADKEA